MILIILILFVSFTYFGYPLVLWIVSHFRGYQSVPPLISWPTLTVLIPARNEEQLIEKTIRSVLDSDYPMDNINVLVVSDASTDQTDSLVRSISSANVNLLALKERHGKRGAMEKALPLLDSDIVVAIDASSLLSADTLKKLVIHFADPAVGSVGGAKVILKTGSVVSRGENLYWRYDSLLRSLESKTGSSWVGCEGGLFAIRRELFKLDFSSEVAIDNAICNRVCEQGFVHRYDRTAVVYEPASMNIKQEFLRKVRIVARGLRSHVVFRSLLNPFKRPGYFFQNLCHRIFRYLVPFALLGIFVLSFLGTSAFDRLLFFLQVAFYSLGIVGLFLKKFEMKNRLTAIPSYFLAVNGAAFIAWFLLFKNFGFWTPTVRENYQPNLKEAMFLFISVLLACSHAVARVTTQKSSDGWRLLVDDKPYYVRGMCYVPVNVGESASEGTQRDWMVIDDDHDGKIDAPYQSWVDKNRNNRRDKSEPVVGDFKLLQDMGCNTIRIYHSPSQNPDVQKLYEGRVSPSLMYNHAPNKALLRDLYERFGIRVAMGDLLGAYTVGSAAEWEAGTDYTDPTQRKNMLTSVRDMVIEHKDEPYLLFWILGNENNLEEYTHTNANRNPRAYAEFVNEAAKLIKRLDGDHPVCLSNGEIHHAKVYAELAPEIDIFGLNAYRGPGFGKMWEEIAKKWDRPVILTEYGHPFPKIKKGSFDEDDQVMVHRGAVCDMMRHAAGGQSPQNSIGGFAFEWLDNWWQNGSPWEQHLSSTGWNFETLGLVSQGNGKRSPFLRQPRKAYDFYKALWSGEEQCK